MTDKGNLARDILLGVAVGDALGVPVEFKSRASIALLPVIDMIGYGTLNNPVIVPLHDLSIFFWDLICEASSQNVRWTFR